MNDSVLLRSANGDRADDDRADSDLTDGDGQYRLRGEHNRRYDLTYRQVGAGTNRDGVPAVYAVRRVNASTDRTHNVSLPPASVLNVTVVAENGTPVGDAAVELVHGRDGATAALTGRTDARGRLTVAGRVGVELAGSVTVAVEAPNESLANRTVAVPATAGTREVVLPLNDSDPPTLRYDVARRTVNVSEPVLFDASGSADESGLAGTTWTVDGQPFDSPVVRVSYSEPGTYSAEVVVTDHAGNRNRTTVPMTVVDERAPDPALSANATTALTGEPVAFDASDASDDHRIETYRWDFDGDGTPERNTSEPTVVHEYAANGTFDATVVVEDPSGNRARETRRVTVERPPPTAAFSVTDARPRVGEPVTFDASPSSAGPNLTEYVWTFEGGKQVPDQRTITTRLPDSGTYNVTLTVTDEYGRTDARTRTIVVPNKPPQADAGSDRTAVAGEAVTLDGSYSTDPDDDVAFEWTQIRANRTDGANETDGANRTADASNGTDATNATGGTDATDATSRFRDPAVALSNASAVAPTFTAPNVTATERLRFAVTVSDDHGATDTDSVSVTVVPRAPPNLTHSPASPAVGEAVTFRANRSGAYRWDFDGDGAAEAASGGSNATNATATHRFDAAGKYEVTLVDAVGRTVNRTVTVVGNESDAGNVGGSPAARTEGNRTAASKPAGDGTVTAAGGAATGATDGGAAGSGATGGTDGATDDGATGGTDGGGSPDGGSQNGRSATAGDADGDRSVGGSEGVDGSEGGDGTGDADSKSVSVERVGGGDRIVAAVENVGADEAATVRLPAEFGGNRSAFESVAVVPDGASNFSLAVAVPDGPPEGTPRPDADAVLSYLTVEERDLADAAVGSARFRFRVAVERLDAAGVSPAAVRLYRYHAGEWQTLATNHTATERGFHRFEAVSPGFSAFAIGVADGTADVSGSGASAEPADATSRSRGSADDSAGDAGDAGQSDADDAESDDRRQSGEGPTPDGGAAGSDDASGSDLLLMGLFGTALVAAALWGYLLS